MVCACILFNSNNGARGSLPPSLFFWAVWFVYTTAIPRSVRCLCSSFHFWSSSMRSNQWKWFICSVHMQCAHAVCTCSVDWRIWWQMYCITDDNTEIGTIQLISAGLTQVYPNNKERLYDMYGIHIHCIIYCRSLDDCNTDNGVHNCFPKWSEVLAPDQ